MKKLTLLACFGLLAFLGACNNDSAVEGLYEESKSGNTINIHNQEPENYNRDQKNKSEAFGYVRHQKSPIMGDQVSDSHYSAIDREKVADTISRLSTALPNVDDVSTLVTGEEVLVVYDTDSNNRELTADQVKKTALSVVPRWYHVYVSDNIGLRQNVENFASLDSDSEKAEYAIDKLIKDMKKSPQGKKVNNEENANGETTEDVEE